MAPKPPGVAEGAEVSPLLVIHAGPLDGLGDLAGQHGLVLLGTPEQIRELARLLHRRVVVQEQKSHESHPSTWRQFGGDR